jgi:hypothetical protein
MPSIAVVGNCQAPPIADILARIVPGAAVTAFPLTAIKTDIEREKTARCLQDFDLIFMQPLTQPKHGALRAAKVQARNTNVILYPAMIFKGFHPDFFGGVGGKETRSAAVSYHSCLVAAAFANGVPVEKVQMLFNAYNFARLGYFREYTAGRAFFLLQAAELGYELSHKFGDWERSGVFMHTPNHPSLAVLTSIAAAAAEKAGLPVEGAAANGMQDKLGRLLRLPVYPAIAKRLRISSESEFMVWRPKGAPRTFDLKDYIAETYALYASVPTSFFEQKAIQRAAAVLN